MTLMLSLITGICLLLLGGHVLVRHAVGIAARLNIPSMVIGATIVAFGTSAPELVISLEAVLTAHDDIVIGNIIGSNIANLLLVLAISAVICPFRVPVQTAAREGVILTAATLLFIWHCWNGQVSRLEGAVLLAAITGYTILSFATSSPAEPISQAGQDTPTAAPPGRRILADILAILGSLVALAAGSQLFVDGAVELSRILGVSEAVIGLTIVALGTAAPEIVTAAIAAWKRHSEVAFGNVIGSSIFNLLGITGVTALVMPVEVRPKFLGADSAIMLGATVAVIALSLVWHRLGRSAGAIMLLAYAGYMISLY